jgi:hypothetical protein
VLDPLRYLLMPADSPSIVVACMRPLHPCLFVLHKKLALLLHNIAHTGVLSSFHLTLFSCLNGSVYCFLDLALGARTIDSSAIDLVNINRDCFGHLWDQRRQAKLTKEVWNLAIEDYRAVAT